MYEFITERCAAIRQDMRRTIKLKRKLPVPRTEESTIEGSCAYISYIHEPRIIHKRTTAVSMYVQRRREDRHIVAASGIRGLLLQVVIGVVGPGKDKKHRDVIVR